MEPITITALIKAPITQVWECWTLPKHIVNWNFASADWHCPQAENNFTIGGEFHYLMAAKDESFQFDFWGTYTNIEEGKTIDLILGDGRKVSVCFETAAEGVILTEKFDPESQNPVELQRAGWQSILDQFKNYAEGQSSD